MLIVTDRHVIKIVGVRNSIFIANQFLLYTNANIEHVHHKYSKNFLYSNFLLFCVVPVIQFSDIFSLKKKNHSFRHIPLRTFFHYLCLVRTDCVPLEHTCHFVASPNKTHRFADCNKSVCKQITLWTCKFFKGFFFINLQKIKHKFMLSYLSNINYKRSRPFFIVRSYNKLHNNLPLHTVLRRSDPLIFN